MIEHINHFEYNERIRFSRLNFFYGHSFYWFIQRIRHNDETEWRWFCRGFSLIQFWYLKSLYSWECSQKFSWLFEKFIPWQIGRQEFDTWATYRHAQTSKLMIDGSFDASSMLSVILLNFNTNCYTFYIVTIFQYYWNKGKRLAKSRKLNEKC